MIGGYQVGAFQPAYQQGAPAPAPRTGGGGSGKRYPVGNLDLETWRRKHTKIKSRIEQVQKKIQAKRDKFDGSSLEKVEKLKKQIAELHAILLKLLAELDDARKSYEEAEEAEVLAIYMIHRTLH